MSEGQFARISLPLVRRIYPQLIANKLVETQPLLGPTGLVYYLRHQYAQNRKNQPQPGWTVKPKKKKIWRDITEPWEVTQDGME